MHPTGYRPGVSTETPHLWFLAIDLGSGGTKAAAVSVDGTVLGAQFASTHTVLGPDGSATQDVHAWWTGMVDGIRAVLASGTVRPGDCAGVGITGQWGSTVPVDAGLNAIGPCIMWSDGRGAPFSGALVGGRFKVSGYDLTKLATWIRLTGGAPSPQGADPTGHALLLRHTQPQVYQSAAWLMEPVDYIGMRLTGVVAATPASMILSWLTDNRPNAAHGYHPKLVALAGRDPGRLPRLLPTGSVLGTLSAPVAAELGLPITVSVVTGIPDLHTAWLGSGAVGDYQGHLAISTSAWVSAAVPFKKTDINASMATVPALRPGAFLIANNHETGGASLRWFREQILAPHDALSTGPVPTYEQITEAAAVVAPGSGGVIFAPWLKGERSPVDDRRLRASFVNVSLETTRVAMARAVLEGVAYNARWLLEATEKLAKRPLTPLRLLGGGAQSPLWCQIHADVIGRPIEQVSQPMHANVRGAGLFAALSLGTTSLERIAQGAFVARTFHPDAAARLAYEPLYSEFTKLFKQQKAMYHRLHK